MNPLPVKFGQSPYDTGTMHDVHNMLEALTNLVYLTRLGSEQPGDVRGYMESADVCVRRLSQILTDDAVRDSYS